MAVPTDEEVAARFDPASFPSKEGTCDGCAILRIVSNGGGPVPSIRPLKLVPGDSNWRCPSCLDFWMRHTAKRVLARERESAEQARQRQAAQERWQRRPIVVRGALRGAQGVGVLVGVAAGLVVALVAVGALLTLVGHGGDCAGGNGDYSQCSP